MEWGEHFLIIEKSEEIPDDCSVCWFCDKAGMNFLDMLPHCLVYAKCAFDVDIVCYYSGRPRGCPMTEIKKRLKESERQGKKGKRSFIISFPVDKKE